MIVLLHLTLFDYLQSVSARNMLVLNAKVHACIKCALVELIFHQAFW